MFRRARVDKIKYIYVSNLPSFWWEDFVDMELQILICGANVLFVDLVTPSLISLRLNNHILINILT